jgi:RHS repeat-associated protein
MRGLWQTSAGMSPLTTGITNDRLGTNRYSGAYYPYGDGTAGYDTFQFATYTRDSYTGLDYADQRYYASTYGRFDTADQYMASAGPGDPGSWNRYAYVRSDPINRVDPSGRDDELVCAGADGSSSNDASCGVESTSLNQNINCPQLDQLGMSAWQNSAAMNPDPACYTLPEQSAPPELCPLIGIVGDYTLAPSWPVYAEFAPALAYDVDEALAILNGEDVVPQINSGYRSVTAQGSIPTNNPYPVAKPGQSWHNVGLAIDIQLNPNTKTGQEIIAAMESVGLTWGGTFSRTDNVHFQLPGAVVSNGVVYSGKPSPAQVAACQAEHPNGH